MWEELERTLCDLRFIEAKCSAGMTYDLVADYDATLADGSLPASLRPRISEFARFVRAQAHVLAKHPHLAFQQAFNQPDGSAPERAARELAASGVELRPRLRIANAMASMNIATLVGHSSGISSCDISPDGSFVISASDDGTLRVWDAARGILKRTLYDHHASVETCAIAASGGRMASGDRKGGLLLWKSFDGGVPTRCVGHTDAIATCAFSPYQLNVHLCSIQDVHADAQYPTMRRQVTWAND